MSEYKFDQFSKIYSNLILSSLVYSIIFPSQFSVLLIVRINVFYLTKSVLGVKNSKINNEFSIFRLVFAAFIKMTSHPSAVGRLKNELEHEHSSILMQKKSYATK